MRKQSVVCNRTYNAVGRPTDVETKKLAMANWNLACSEYYRLQTGGSASYDPECEACVVNRLVRGL